MIGENKILGSGSNYLVKFFFIKRFIKIALTFVLLVLAWYRCFDGLETASIEKWDEAVFLEVVKDSINNNSFLIPTLSSSNGEFGNLSVGGYFYEKPPFWFWLAYILGSLSGVSLYTMRMISAVSGLILIFLTYFWGTRYLSFKVGFLGALVLMSTGHMFVFNPAGVFSSHHIRSVNLDILQMVFIFCSQVCAMEYIKRKNRIYIYLMSIFSGIAVLTKGFFALSVPLLTLIYLRFIGESLDQSEFFKIASRTIIITFFVIVPWYIYAFAVGGFDFLRNHFVYHNVARVVSTLEGHGEGAFFYITNLFKFEFFLFGPLLIYGIIKFFRRMRSPEFFFLVGYPIFCLVVITLVQTKLAWYALYIYPFASIIVAKVIVDSVGEIRMLWHRARSSMDSLYTHVCRR